MNTHRHTLFPLGEMEAGSVRRVDIADHKIALVRIDDDVYAIGDTCTHADVSLSEGFVEEADMALECPSHGAMFDVKTGEALSLPATRPVPTYEVAVVDGEVVVTVEPTEENS